LHAIADRVCGRDVSISEYGAGIDQLADAVEEFLSVTVGQNISNEEVITELKEVELKESLVKIILTTIAARRDEITKQLKNKHLLLAPVYLKDFDWSLRMTLSSDKLSTLREPLLLLSLSLHENGQTRDVHLELSKSELDVFLKSCEEIHREVVKLTVT